MSTSCPFCAIAAAYPPFPPGSAPPTSPSPFPPPTSTTTTSPSPSPSPNTPPYPLAHILLSTPSVLAFLDHAPISRGHVLLATRRHCEKLSDVSVAEGRMLGAWLGVVSRAVVGGALGGDKEGDKEGEGKGEVGDWNVVQNNGIRAAQVVPHVHFHIIPRPGDVPVIENRSWTIFGRGQREDLDEEDAVGLVGRMRVRLGREVERVRRVEGGEGGRALGLDGEGEGEVGRDVERDRGGGVDGWGRRVRGKL